jgi:hypothetical protein
VVGALQEELREHVAAEDWPAAVAVADELERLSPDDSDPDGLATTARTSLHHRGQKEPQRQAQQESEQEQKRAHDHKQPPPPSHVQKYVLAGAVLLLLGGGIAWIWTLGRAGGGTSQSFPPPPFKSAALYELARHHFDPGDCQPLESPSDAPLAWEVPHTEALKCHRPDGTYDGALLCAGDMADFRTIHDTYLDKADGDPQPVTELPAGRDEPWPFQVSYLHVGGGAGRVYWDDPSSLCAVELQVDETDVQVALSYFASGTGS